MTLLSLIQLTELSQLHTFLRFLQKRNFLECGEIEVSLRDGNVTSSVYAEHLFWST